MKQWEAHEFKGPIQPLIDAALQEWAKKHSDASAEVLEDAAYIRGQLAPMVASFWGDSPTVR